MWREHEIVFGASCLELRIHLQEMTMVVADTICAKIFADLSEQQIGARCESGARYSARGGNGNRRFRLEQFFFDERMQRQQNGCRVAARIGDDVCAANFVAVELRESVWGTRPVGEVTVVTGPQVG